MAKISKPGANPIAALLLTAFVLGIGHLVINGQQRKWLFTTIPSYILAPCCGIGLVIYILSIIDSYQTAQRLQKGEEIEENEYTNALLFKIMKMIDKSAVGPAA